MSTLQTEHTSSANPARFKESRPRINDLLWKGILEDTFEDFISFVNPHAVHHFDFQKGVEFLDKELEQVFPPEGDQYRPKVVDKLVKVCTLQGEEKLVLVHIEVQAKYDEGFGQRMFTYFYRIYDKYQKPITAYAILTEHTRARVGSFDLSYQGTNLLYSFNVYKIADQKEEELLASQNPFALVVLIAKTALTGKKLNKQDQARHLMELKLNLAKELLSRDIPKDKVNALMGFLKHYIRFSKPENNLIFEQQLQQLTDRKTTMGIEELLLDMAKHEGKLEGKIEGKLEGRHEEALQIAREMKNDKFPVEQIMKLTKLSLQEIKAL